MGSRRRRPLERRRQMIMVTAWVLVVALIVGVLASLLFINVR
ncbi:MAG TPA: hypothetical protein VG779_00325 [Actinomycetota bacterium]|jgi:hypothetical protein|nr:hypothetical protein [Actinomycetota bacterium]